MAFSCKRYVQNATSINTTMRALLKSNSFALLFSSCLIFGQAENSTELTFPSFRYILWGNLENATFAAANVLFYTKSTWNIPGTNGIEFAKYSDLTPDQQGNVSAIGFDQPTWDCYQGHYAKYTWAELVELDLAQHLFRLGFTETNWTGSDLHLMETLNKTWDELTTDEQAAAGEICLFQQNWDMSNLTFYPGVEDLPDEIFAPSAAPTALAFPNFRYIAWQKSDNYTRFLAMDGLQYTELTWNTPGSAAIEKITFSGLTLDQQNAATSIGFYEGSWDCYQNHFKSYEWGELAEQGVQQHYVTLGWTEESWKDEIGPPESEYTIWSGLSSEEKAAAGEVCYFQGTWDGLSIPDFGKSMTSSGPTVPLSMLVTAVAIGLSLTGLTGL